MNTRTPAATTAMTPSTLDEQFTAAYTQYQPMVRRIILGELKTGDTHLADDLTQNTFLALYSYRNRLDMDRDLGGLLHTMAKQSISHHFRVMRNTREKPTDTGSWQYTNREMNAAGAYYKPAATGFRIAAIGHAGDSDPDMDEALRRVRKNGGAR